jgi:FKBP-type peptidyl-prolyl cis-trans isomerase FkpA
MEKPMKTSHLFAFLSSLVFSTSAFAASSACNATGTGADLANEKCLSQAYLTAMAAETDATVVAGGIVMRPLFLNSQGAHPEVSDTVTVGYALTDRTGKLLEETSTGDDLATFSLDGLIACWRTAIPKMTVGSLYKITCPSDTAYGDAGAGDGEIKGGTALTFRITLFAVQTSPGTRR